jgi:BioD-like phosphotransacetylase family protein
LAKNVVISGETRAGKTMVALALASKLRAEGKSVNYFKPVGTKSFEYSTESMDVDVDAAVMKDVLGMKADLSCICPIVRTFVSHDELLRVGHDVLLKKIKECYAEISEGVDYVLIEGTKAPWHLLHVNLSTPQIAKEFDASVICLVNFSNSAAIDDILLQKSLFQQHGIDSIGIMLKRVPPMLKDTVKEKIQPFLEEAGLRFCGVVFQNRDLFSPNVGEILRALDGEMTTGDDKLGVLVDHFMIGSMAPENALKWFRRAHDMAVITSGDRPDICLAALETDTSLLILTGGIEPDIRTVSRAKEQDIPIMMTAHDTYTTSRIVDGLLGTITPENKEKVSIIEQIVGEALDLSCLEL